VAVEDTIGTIVGENEGITMGEGLIKGATRAPRISATAPEGGAMPIRLNS
jgi:hypothetical protein